MYNWKNILQQKGDKSRINAVFHKALKRGLCHTSLETDELIVTADKRLFGHVRIINDLKLQDYHKVSLALSQVRI